MAHHDPSRRMFLGRAIVLGGTVVIPGALAAGMIGDSEAAADDPRSANRPAGVENEDKPVKDPPPEQAGNKITKAQAQYQDQPNGEEKCANCAHFLAVSNNCKLVEGDVAPEGWCKLWVTSA